MIKQSLSHTLSIVIPVYNVSKYVIEAIDSVINQTISPYEIVIVNDGSTDDSAELIENSYSAHPHIKIVHTQNQGLGEARNVGTKIATGDYIYYFDSDDILVSNMVEEFYDALKKNPGMDLFAFAAESFTDDLISAPTSENLKLPQYSRSLDGIYADGEIAFCELSKCNCFYPNAWLYVFRRKLYTSNNLSFKPIIHEDEEFTPRLYFFAGLTVVSREKFFLRRVRVGSIMQTNRSEKNVIGYLSSIEALEDLLSQSSRNESKRYLKERITLNLIHIISVNKELSSDLTKLTLDNYNSMLSKYGNIYTKTAKISLFSYRALKFLSKKVLPKFKAL